MKQILSLFCLSLFLTACPSPNLSSSTEAQSHSGEITLWITRQPSNNNPLKMELDSNQQSFSQVRLSVLNENETLDTVTLAASISSLENLSGRRFKFLPETELIVQVELLNGDGDVLASVREPVSTKEQAQTLFIEVIKSQNPGLSLQNKLREIERVGRELGQVQGQISYLLEQIRILKNTDNSDAKNQLAVLQSTLADLQTRKNKLNLEKAALEQERLVLETQFANDDNLSPSLKQEVLKNKISILEQQLTESQKQETDLKSQLALLLRSPDLIEKSIAQEIQTDLFALNAEVTQLKIDLSQAQRILHSLGDTNQTTPDPAIEERLKILKQEKQELEQERLALLEKQDDQNQSRLLNIDAALKRLNEEVNQLEKALKPS